MCHAQDLPLEQVNEIVNQILPIFEDRIKDPVVGKSVHETYVLRTFKLFEELEKVYLEMRPEAIDLGIPLDD